MTAGLRVGFDARLWHHTGIGRYIDNMLARLAGPGWLIWVRPADLDAARAAWPGAEVRACAAPPFSLSEQVFWARTLPLAPIDLFHAPHFNAPLACPVPLVATLHDMIPLRFAGSHRHRLGTWYFHALCWLVVRRATRVIVDAAHTRTDLIALLGAPAGRIRAILLAADPRFATPQPRALCERWVQGRPYILYAGQWKRYKNVETLIAAFAQLTVAHPTLVLVLAGRVDPHATQVPAAIARHALAERVVLTGYLPQDELVALYQGAAVFAFPSRYEGFGLPPLEAMAAGVPVVSSGEAALTEVLADAALLVGPDDVAGWAAALGRVLTDAKLRADLIARGRARALALDWEATARQTAAVYREAMDAAR